MLKCLGNLLSFRNREAITGSATKFMGLTRIPGYGDEGSGNFQYVKCMGKGGQSIVAEVYDLETFKFYALKIIKNDGEPTRVRFMNELYVHYSLADHSSILPIFAAFKDTNNFYILMELAIRGLNDFIYASGGVPEGPYLKCIMKQVLLAVDHCHSNKVMHRDIKPDNFLISTDGKLKLADFGLAWIQFSGQKCSDPAGTRLYAAPEMLSGQPFGLKSDMYSVGLTMYVLLRGYVKELDLYLASGIVPSRSFMESLSAPCCDLLTKLLNHIEESRPSAREAMAHEWFF